jgi:hypothetical protein
MSERSETSLFLPQEFLDSQTDVFGDLAEENRGYISAFMERHGGIAAIRMAEVLVGTTLPDFREAKCV